MIRFHSRRVVNIVAGLTAFWCGILSTFFWIKGYNFNFLFLMLMMVTAGFSMASVSTNAYKNDILTRLGFKPSRNLPITDRNAFSTVTQGVFSSIGPVPFQYTFPARLNSARLKDGELSRLVASKLPKELVKHEEFLAKFITAIDSGPHAKLIRAILEVYCHPSHIDLPAGITHHNGEYLLTHSLCVAALMYHRADNFSLKNYYILLNEPKYKITNNDNLLIAVGLAHDLGKINSFIMDSTGTAKDIKPNHHKSSCRLISSLPEFWDDNLSPEDRYIIQSTCIYSTDFLSSPIQTSLLEQSKPKAVSDRLQFLIELTAHCDIIASQLENGVKYDLNTSSNFLETPEIQDNGELIQETKIDLFQKFSEYIASDAIINGKGSDRSIGFKYLDNSKEKPRHFLFLDENEFSPAFALFLKKPEWANKENKSHALTLAILPKLDEAGYLVRSNDIGAQPAVNCLYKVDFVDGNPEVISFTLRSCFVLDLTDWPNQNKLREMASCHSKPIIVNSIFGNKFAPIRTSVTDNNVYEELGIDNVPKSTIKDVESLIKSKQSQKIANQQLNSHTIISRIKSGLAKKRIRPAMETAIGQPIPIGNADEFFTQVGVKLVVCDPATDYLKSLGIMSIRNSKKHPGTHIVVLDPIVYPQNAIV